MLEQNRFLRVWHQLTGQRNMELLFSALEKHYSEPSRSYHNAQHMLAYAPSLHHRPLPKGDISTHGTKGPFLFVEDNAPKNC